MERFGVGDKAFVSSSVSLDELEEFYRVDEGWVPADRPYVWNIYVMSLTGIVTYLDYGYPDLMIGLGGAGIALSHMRGKWPEAEGSAVDARCLRFGWSVADAIVSGSGNMKVRRGSTYDVKFDDFRRYRRELGKDVAPLRVVLTAEGLKADELRYPIYNEVDGRTLIATSERGYEAIEREAQGLSAEFNPLGRCMFEVLGAEKADVEKLMRLLRSKYGVRLADLEGGPHVSHEFFLARLVDEFRLTVSPVFVDSLNGRGEQRLTPLAGEGFGPLDSPTGQVIGRRFFGDFTFLRTQVRYHP